MTFNEPERLLAEVWVRRLEWIRDRLRSSREIESLLRHAFHMAQLTPMRWSGLVEGFATETDFESALANEEWSEAANLLLGDRVKVVRLTPTHGSMAVSVRCDRASGSAIGADFPQAALGAWMARLLDAVRREDPSIELE